MSEHWQQFWLSVLMVLVGPFLAPLISGLLNKAFEPTDWVLFCIMYLFAVAASTRSKLLGVVCFLSALVGTAIYGSQPDNGDLPGARWAMVILPVAATAIAHLSERVGMHLVRRETFW